MKTISKTAIREIALAGVLLGTTSFNVPADQSAMVAGHEKAYIGQIISIEPKEHTFTVRSWISKKHFDLGNNCTYVMLGNNNGSIADLRLGEKVTVHYQAMHGVQTADRIEQQPMRFEGIVVAFDPGKHELILRHRGLDKPMRIDPACNVILQNNKSGTLADIRLGDHVTATYETPNDLPTARQIVQTSAEFTGKLTAIDLGEKTVKAKDTFSTMKFNLANDCTIVINGKTNGKLSELRPDERLVFDYDSVNGVNVVNRIAPVPPESQKNPVVTSTPGDTGYPGGF